MNKINLKNLLADFDQLQNPSKAKLLSGFFKTGKGQYGEGDIFLGLTVPQQRILAKKYIDLNFNDLQFLIDSKIHEHRLTGLIILTYQYEKVSKNKSSALLATENKHQKINNSKRHDIKHRLASALQKDNEKEKDAELQTKQIFYFYLKNSKKVNNWDLVDVTCHRIVGEYLLNKSEKEKQILYKLANSQNLWEKRIAIISTYRFIRNAQFEDTLKISEILMHDEHDLIHKAVGWMLREVGKRDEKVEKLFLDKHARHMPRTMLRYAIERFDEKSKKYYMNIKNG